MGKTLKVELLQTCFVIEDFRSNGTGIALGNTWRFFVLKVRRDFILVGLLIQDVGSTLTFKASMLLLANLAFRNRRFLVSVGSPTLTALNSLFEEISIIIP